ncbi:keratin, type I cytoskeletal 12-like isoform X2 [Spea bombifrons]|uniref:keratin, type I cytoskeletal 12-like isoform X2 n=1 Tax=Spea bombifrons TaxID=233779 RepID=UPI00234B9543|nr:keratin, type I cytoskeletal 12-like isoform X2 [Spea bombifrons]
MPYGSRTALVTSPVFSHAVSPAMSYNGQFNALRAKTPRLHRKGSRLSCEKWTDSGNLFCRSQKDTLIHLNDRLAAYLEKVRLLEESNRHLEVQIKELLAKRANIGCDASQYEKTITELETQINEAKVANSELFLTIENTKLAADGFKAKYEAELALQRAIGADIKELKTTGSHLEMEKQLQETELQILTRELQCLKKDHNEDVQNIQEQCTGHVNVEVKTQQAADLSKYLSEMRQQYEAIIDKQKRDTEAWFNRKSKECMPRDVEHNESLQSQKKEVFKLRQKLQELEVQLEVLHGMKSAREATLYETESTYCAYLQNIQEKIGKREDELLKIRDGAQRLSSERRILTYLKDLLEMEITTYSVLMDEEESRMEDVTSGASNGFPRSTNSKQKSTSVVTKHP